MVLGYARCSTEEQNLDWQEDALKKAGCERIYAEKVSGTKADRPELMRLLDTLREGDLLVVCELTRLSRSTKDLFALVERISEAKADIRSLKETWLDTTTPQGRLMFTITAGISQFERDLTVQRTKDGLAAARARGHLGGRPKKEGKDVKQALALYDSGDYTVKQIQEMTGVSRTTLYAYIKERKSFNQEVSNGKE